MSCQQEKDVVVTWRPTTFTALGVVALWFFLGWIVPHHFKVEGSAGVFGDMFGGVNALFSGLAFAGIIYTILLQRHELKLQRDELELTRAELKGQKEQLSAQNETFRQQNFENTFFQLLRLHNDIVNAIDLKSLNWRPGNRSKSTTERVTEGRDCFAIFHRRLIDSFDENKSANDSDPPESFGRIYSLVFYPDNEQNIGHYFRSLYNIVKFIDASAIPNKRLYTNLVRAQLSRFEVALLFYNCISPLGLEKFLPLVERYSLLKMINASDLFFDKHIMFYSESAYGKQGS